MPGQRAFFYGFRMIATAIDAPRQLAELRPRTVEGREDGEWIVFDDIPVFDEHTGDDDVKYDRRLLSIIAENNNRRIRDTGDFCAVVVGHTGDDDGGDDPPVIGFAGPFTMGKLGAEVPRACINAKFWIFPEHAETFRRNPRRSVEIWPEERPEERYFDPLAILGAETPKRDLGLLYSKLPAYSKFRYEKRNATQRPIRYEASVPAGGNVFLPSTGGIKKRPQANDKGPNMPFSSEDLAQLTEALKPTIESLVSAMIPVADTADNSPPMEYDQEPEPELDSPPLEGADLAYAKRLTHRMAKYMEGENDVDPMQYMDEADKELLQQYKYECSDEEKEIFRKYEEDGAAIPAPPVDEVPIGSPELAAKRYRKQRDAYRLRYGKSKRENDDLKAENVKLKRQVRESQSKARYNKRRSVFSDLQSKGYVLDIQEELEHTEDFSDDQFERHAAGIVVRYQKAPLGHLDLGQDRPGPMPGSKKAKSEKYAKQAQAETYRRRKNGERVEYEDVLQEFIDNNGRSQSAK